jgi:hypothetical protein
VVVAGCYVCLLACLQVMALNAKGITACFLGSAQQSAQVREDAWRGGWVRQCWAGGGQTASLRAVFYPVSHPLVVPPPTSAHACRWQFADGAAPDASNTALPVTALPAGLYQFVYITPELAANAIDRLRALRDSVVRAA